MQGTKHALPSVICPCDRTELCRKHKRIILYHTQSCIFPKSFTIFILHVYISRKLLHFGMSQEEKNEKDTE